MRCPFRLTLNPCGTPAQCQREPGHKGNHSYTIRGAGSLLGDLDHHYLQRSTETIARCWTNKPHKPHKRKENLMSVDPATTLIDPTWYQDHDQIALTARYLADEAPANADRIAHFIEKPWHYEAAYREAKRREAEENQEVEA